MLNRHLPLGAESCPRQTEIEAEARSSVPGSSIDRALAFTSSYVPAFDFVPEPLKRFESNRMGQSNDRQSRFQNW
jgi:hypothetical protein